MEPSAVLGFWFEPRIDEPLYVREEWFRKSDSFDGEIRARFAPEIELALSGRLDDWSATREGTLALILLLDQFTRNVFRETPPAFSGDIAALSHVGDHHHASLRERVREGANEGRKKDV